MILFRNINNMIHFIFYSSIKKKILLIPKNTIFQTINAKDECTCKNRRTYFYPVKYLQKKA